jgi:hypothetical protein
MPVTTSGPLSAFLRETQTGCEHHAISRDINRDETSQSTQIFPLLAPNGLAEIVTLDCMSSNQARFHISLGSCKARKCLPFEHIFKPEEHMPESAI